MAQALKTYGTDNATYATFKSTVGDFAKAHERMFETLLAIGIGCRQDAHHYVIRFVAEEQGATPHQSRKAPHNWIFDTDSKADSRFVYLMDLLFPKAPRSGISKKAEAIKVPTALKSAVKLLLTEYSAAQIREAVKLMTAK